MKTISNTIEFDQDFLGEPVPYIVDYTSEINSAVGTTDEYGRQEMIDDSEIVINQLWLMRESGELLEIPEEEQYKEVFDEAYRVIQLDIDKQS